MAAATLKRFDLEIPEIYALLDEERVLRQYASAFGLSYPQRLEPERPSTDEELIDAIERCLLDRPSRVIICSVEPSTRLVNRLASLRRKLARRRVRISWLCMNATAGLPSVCSSVQAAVNDGIRWRAKAAHLAFRSQLPRLGIDIERLPKRQNRMHRTEMQ
jgi:inosine-uridine nucleoside N-ribohydrolase